jgi:hypothetical protein
MNFGYSTSFQSMDKGLIEKIGPSGFSFSVYNVSSNFVNYSSGFLYHVIFIMIFSAFMFLSIYFCYAFSIVNIINFQFILLIFTFFLISLFRPNINLKD